MLRKPTWAWRAKWSEWTRCWPNLYNWPWKNWQIELRALRDSERAIERTKRWKIIETYSRKNTLVVNSLDKMWTQRGPRSSSTQVKSKKSENKTPWEAWWTTTAKSSRPQRKTSSKVKSQSWKEDTKILIRNWKSWKKKLKGSKPCLRDAEKPCKKTLKNMLTFRKLSCRRRANETLTMFYRIKESGLKYLITNIDEKLLYKFSMCIIRFKFF